MGKVVRIKKRGRVVLAKLVPEAAAQVAGESDDRFARRRELTELVGDVLLHVPLVHRDTVISWSHRFDLWNATENRRRHDMEKTGQILPDGATEEAAREISALHKDVIRESGVRVAGLEREDGVPSFDLGAEDLVELLDDGGLIADVSRRVREIQSLTLEQVER